MAEVRRAPPATLDDLKLTVEAFSESLDKEEVIRSVKHTRERAQVCSLLQGAAFEAKLNKLRKKLNNEE